MLYACAGVTVGVAARERAIVSTSDRRVRMVPSSPARLYTVVCRSGVRAARKGVARWDVRGSLRS